MNDELYTDHELVYGLIHNEDTIVEYFFKEKCSKLLHYILWHIFSGKVDSYEMMNELYIYLAENDWHKLRQFDYRSKLTTWLSVVATRFFMKKRKILVDSISTEHLLCDIDKSATISGNDKWMQRYDIMNVISQMPNQRYRKIIERMDIEGASPDVVAKELGITIANLYNIRHRAHMQLSAIIGRKEEWYD